MVFFVKIKINLIQLSVIPLLPLFHHFNRAFFENSLVEDNKPLIKVRWSDNRLKTTAGFYKKRVIGGLIHSEIVLSKPILEKLTIIEIQSTLCHEMIHAWIDRILKINEIHGPIFKKKMKEINNIQDIFEINIRHDFPVLRRDFKFKGRCIKCGNVYLYRRRMFNLSCKKCCNTYFRGVWSKSCLIVFENI